MRCRGRNGYFTFDWAYVDANRRRDATIHIMSKRDCGLAPIVITGQKRELVWFLTKAIKAIRNGQYVDLRASDIKT